MSMVATIREVGASRTAPELLEVVLAKALDPVDQGDDPNNESRDSEHAICVPDALPDHDSRDSVQCDSDPEIHVSPFD
jgi:hypothetical protein